MHPDIVGKADPAVHFISHGADEGRRAARPTHIARTLGDLASNIPTHGVNEGSKQVSHVSHVSPTIGLYVSSLGNVFMREIAAAIGELLRTAGHSVTESDENSDIEARPERCVFVAPHEFFFLGRGPQWVRDDVLATACMYCTEQVQTRWFWNSLHIVLMAKSVIEISAPLAAAFSEVMPSACVFPSVCKTSLVVSPEVRTHPLLSGQRWWMDDPSRDDQLGRPLDLCFFGTVSPSRARFFVRNAERLSPYESFVYLRSGNAAEPMNAITGETRLTGVAQFVARNARVLLNIHRDEFPYFEWHRLVYQGMANGCTVVSEPCFANPEFKPGVHYLAEEAHRLMGLVDWILNDPDGKDKALAVAETAAAAARDAMSEAARARAFLNILMI